MTAEAAAAADKPRAAATVILVRRGQDGPAVLMGQRGAQAVFMPSKYVFPGGGLDLTDADTILADALGGPCRARIEQWSEPGLAHALSAAALRELWEETGLALAVAGRTAPDWSGFQDSGLTPSAAGLRFFFRAITPPGRSRRFDARFFLADAAALAGDPDDFGHASDELSHLHWVPVAQARQLNLPFITEVVLAELGAFLATVEPDAPLPIPASVPFFDNSGPVPTFRRIY